MANFLLTSVKSDRMSRRYTGDSKEEDLGSSVFRRSMMKVIKAPPRGQLRQGEVKKGTDNNPAFYASFICLDSNKIEMNSLRIC